MTKEEYIRELRARISHLPKEEQESALRYYMEYLEDAGDRPMEQIIEELGTPQQVAERIIADCAQSAGEAKSAHTGCVLGTLAVVTSPVYHRFAHLCLWSGCAGTHRGRHLVADPLSSHRNCGAGRCADLCGFDAAVCRTVLVGSRCGQIGLEDDKTKKKRLMRAHAR